MNRYYTVPLSDKHDKTSFSSGNLILDRYLYQVAGQDFRRYLSVCFVRTTSPRLKSIAGYYTLSQIGLSNELVPEPLRKKLPNFYEQFPVTLLGRLAVDQRFKGQKMGESLLIDALFRTYEVSVNSAASTAVVVDPMGDQVKAFYERYGFVELPGSKKLFLPMKTIATLFK